MSEQSAKTKIINNIIVQMKKYINKDVLAILECIIEDELVKVNVQEITTLPDLYKNDTDKRNKYIVELFDIKKGIRLKPKTKEGYLRAVKKLIMLIDKPLDAMDETDISYYLRYYENRNLNTSGKKNQATTVNNERRFLSAFFSWMRKEKLISDNPVEGTDPLKTIRKPIDYFKPEEIAMMRDVCKNKRERALLEVLRSTGARIGEIAPITIDQIDWSTGDILILGEKRDVYRPIYLDADAKYYYSQYLNSRSDDSPYMFPQERRPYGMMTTSGLRAVLKRIGKRAGVKTRVYPHKLRKTLGMNLKNKGVDIGDIQEIMGHASPAVTAMYYAQSTPETLRRVRKGAA
ncbi:tyrosine-type recombinase/integrase [Murimonas intestini]|uniref:tyrosine-type recombinase/integrase n=1 Tax=Murimonas intestini TaxID=1337051 RepID=UPI00248B0BD7|nr:tyrosine-type recombinase/integrase [Murimonas intestini]